MKGNRTDEGNSQGNNERRVELKYCEYCGSLWTREYRGGQVYCNMCVRQLGNFPAQSAHNRRPLPARAAGFEEVLDFAEGFSLPDDLDLNNPSLDELDLDALDVEDRDLDDSDVDGLDLGLDLRSVRGVL
jgi:hypothetical protein